MGEIDEIEDEINLKINKIRDIHRAGLEVIHVIHRHGLTQDIAKEVEAALIDAYPGVTNIIGGVGNDFGPMNALEIINRYAAETADFQHNILMININKTIDELDIYNATRFAWRIDITRAAKADYILSVRKGIIVGVFVANEWKKARRNNFPEFIDLDNISGFTNNRYGFIGHEASDEIKKLYLRKKIPIQYTQRGAAYPIKYTY